MSVKPAKLTILKNDVNIFNNDDIQYVIPLYQRAFSWKEEELQQLINDIDDFEEGNYYIGSLIVSRKDNTYEVIDGQQRLTALFLLLNSLNVKVNNTLTFACREKSNYTLRNINSLLLDKNIEESLKNGKDFIDTIVKGRDFDKKHFVSQLKKVKVYRIEVPENTDLNRYFEIMNTRGEQLEQHDILKATLMSALTNDGNKALFAKIWDACSDMTEYVQMHFDTYTRSELFGNYWHDAPCIPFGKGSTKGCKDGFTIQNIIQPTFEIDKTDGVTDKDERVRFESIISFPFFLLHTLKVLVASKNIKHIKSGETLIYELLDDKKLTDTFKRIIDNGVIRNKRVFDNKTAFSLDFIECLLKCRFLFDKYIIKREYVNENSDGEWSLKQLEVSGQGYNKKPYYKNTYFGLSGEWTATYEPRNKVNLMIQSCLRVSYTSPKVMHWITTLLHWLYNDESLRELNQYQQVIEDVAKKAVREDYFDKTQNALYNWGVATPHIVFNYLDYLLWKDDQKKHNDFVFEFRNSVEHWYPQHPSEGTFESWSHDDGIDDFGNLCIIQRTINSKFSNMSPEAKKSTFDGMIAKGSLKLKIMKEITVAYTDKNASQNWKDSICREHQKEMITKLLCACIPYEEQMDV